MFAWVTPVDPVLVAQTQVPAISKARTGVQLSKAHAAAISKGMSNYNIPFNRRTHNPAEYTKACRAVKAAEKLAQGTASITTVFKKSEKVRGPAKEFMGITRQGMVCCTQV